VKLNSNARRNLNFIEISVMNCEKKLKTAALLHPYPLRSGGQIQESRSSAFKIRCSED